MADGTQSAGFITATVGDCQVKDVNGNKTPCGTGQVLNWGDTMITGADGRVQGILYDGSRLALGSQSSLQVTHHDSASPQNTLQIWYGAIRGWIASWVRSGGSNQYTPSGHGVGPQIGEIISPDGEIIDPDAPSVADLTFPDTTTTEIDTDTVTEVDTDSYVDPNLDPFDPDNWYTDVWEFDEYGDVYYYGAGGSDVPPDPDPGGCGDDCWGWIE